jgi:transposase
VNHYAGLDVSLEETAICVIDGSGWVVKETRAASEPEVLIATLRESACLLSGSAWRPAR